MVVLTDLVVQLLVDFVETEYVPLSLAINDWEMALGIDTPF